MRLFKRTGSVLRFLKERHFCGGEMVRAVYVGSRRIVKDVGHPDYVPLFVDDEFDENGEPNYIDVDGG